MKHLLSILLISSICLTQEMEVDGDLKVNGSIQNDSLAQVILDQQQQISSLESLILQLQAQISLLESQIALVGGDLGYADCLGIVGGKAVIDDCGICNGNKETLDVCGVCGGEGEEGDGGQGRAEEVETGFAGGEGGPILPRSISPKIV